jgi:hypothetical protein
VQYAADVGLPRGRKGGRKEGAQSSKSVKRDRFEVAKALATKRAHNAAPRQQRRIEQRKHRRNSEREEKRESELLAMGLHPQQLLDLCTKTLQTKKFAGDGRKAQPWEFKLSALRCLLRLVQQHCFSWNKAMASTASHWSVHIQTLRQWYHTWYNNKGLTLPIDKRGSHKHIESYLSDEGIR